MPHSCPLAQEGKPNLNRLNEELNVVSLQPVQRERCYTKGLIEASALPLLT
jgi:hypothetical protein